MHGELFYGSYQLLKHEDADSEKIEELEDLPNARTVVHKEHGTYLYFGVPITNVADHDEKFDEMSLLRVMDLERGCLKDDVREEVKRIIEEVPYEMRDSLSKPGFYIAWGT